MNVLSCSSLCLTVYISKYVFINHPQGSTKLYVLFYVCNSTLHLFMLYYFIFINYVITLLDYIVIICIVFVEWLLTIAVRINSVAFEKVKAFAMTLVSTFIDRLVIVICL